MKTSIVIIALTYITLLEAWALYLGFNGTYLRIVIVVIALLAGVVFPTPKFLKGGLS